jgi:hypothetical protein
MKERYYKIGSIIVSEKDEDFDMYCEFENDIEQYRYHGKIYFCQCPTNLNLSDLIHLRSHDFCKNKYNLRSSEEEFKKAQVRWFWKRQGDFYELIEFDTEEEGVKLGLTVINV